MTLAMRMFLAAVLAAMTLTAAVPANAAIVTRTITYEHDGVTFEGYLAYDDAITDPRPGVLIIHQWLGLSANERMRAEMLARLGYVALAGDVYGQDVRPRNTDEARAQTGKFYADRMLFRERLHAGLQTLKAQPQVDAARCAAIGYCFGGTGALELARMGAEVAGADYQLIMYADAVHSFTQKEAGDDPSRGAAYQAAADRRSWEHMRVFLQEIFDE